MCSDRGLLRRVPAAVFHPQRGFSLAETLFALLLFSLSITALLRFQQALAESFHLQWQQRAAWRDAAQLLLGNPPRGGPGEIRQQNGPEGCQLLTATIARSGGRKAELTMLRCPPVENR